MSYYTNHKSDNDSCHETKNLTYFKPFSVADKDELAYMHKSK